MPENPRDVILRLNAEDTRFMDRVDADLAREMLRTYEAARVELRDEMASRRQELARVAGRDADRERALSEALARDVALFNQIGDRLDVLRTRVETLAREAAGQGLDAGTALAREELEQVRRGLDLGFRFDLVNFDTVEIGLEEALRALVAEQEALGQTLLSGLRLGLLQGESFEQLLERLLGMDGSVWARGPVSALLGARRGVIAAENGARDLLYRSYAERIPGLGKQAIAVVSAETTDCCLRVHGQIQRLDQPYQLTGTPKFADALMTPPFHWNCRTSSVAYHADFEVGSALPTPRMQELARQELARRSVAGR